MLVLKRLYFDNGAASPDDRAAFWTLLGIPASHVEWVMRIDPRWNSETEQLLVRKDVEHDPGGVSSVEAMVGYMLQFRNFSDTRWGGAQGGCKHHNVIITSPIASIQIPFRLLPGLGCEGCLKFLASKAASCWFSS